MALFGLPDNGVSSGDDGSSMAFLMPAAAQAMRYDPRSLLVQSMMGTAQNQLNQPTPNTGSAIAKALTMGLSGLSSAYLEKQYADAAKGAPAEIGAALQSKDPLTALTSSKNPVARMMGFQLAPAVLSKRLTPVTLGPGQQQFMPGSSTPMTTNTAPLSEPGKLAHDIGNTTPIQAETDLTTATKNAQNASDLQFKPKIAGASAAAENPALVNRAVGIASGTAPIETKKAIDIAAGTAPIEVNKAVSIAAGQAPIEAFKELYKPQVNRVTGEVSIPGISDPAVVEQTMRAFRIGPQDLGGTKIAAPPSNVPPPPSPAIVAPVAPGAGPGAMPSAAPPVPAEKPMAPQAAPAAPQLNQTNPALLKASSPPASQPPSQGSAGIPQPPEQKTPVPVGSVNPLEEVPRVGLPTGEMAKQPGTISAGRDPVAIKAGEEAVQQAADQYKDTAETAKAATAMNAQLGAMKTLIDQGRLITDTTGPAREEVAGLLYAATGHNAALARTVTGIDPTAADVFNKESTRLGFNLARQLGAREAAQIVQGAIKANPNLAATKEGNKMVIDTLMAGAQHDIDAQKYADAWFQKNGHYVGAQGWFNQNHPVVEYTSKVLPFQIPRLANGQVDVSKLEPNVTYQGQKGLGIWNGHGFIQVQQ